MVESSHMHTWPSHSALTHVVQCFTVFRKHRYYWYQRIVGHKVHTCWWEACPYNARPVNGLCVGFEALPDPEPEERARVSHRPLVKIQQPDGRLVQKALQPEPQNLHATDEQPNQETV